MGIQEDRIKATTFNHPEYIPVGMGILPAAWMKYRNELNVILKRYQHLFEGDTQKADFDAVGGTYVAGDHIDVWGCVWSNVATGMESIVTGHPVPTREDVRTLKAPEKDAGLPHGFMYLRLADLRGFEEIMIDFAEEPPELQMLIDIVLNYNMKQMDNILKNVDTKGGGILGFGDDLGMQTSLPMSPAKWRKYLKPCYMKLYAGLKKLGHYVYMHTDGHIYEIIPDLKECGVDIINPQFRANGLDNIVRVCKGKICVDLDLDRQMFPFCKPYDIEDQIKQSVQQLGAPEGGLWLKAEVGPDTPLENIEAILASFDKYRGYYKK